MPHTLCFVFAKLVGLSFEFQLARSLGVYSCRTLLFPYYYAENLASFPCETVGFGPAVDIAGCSSAKLPASPSRTSSDIALELELAFELALELKLVN